jgi:hypothetical protein
MIYLVEVTYVVYIYMSLIDDLLPLLEAFITYSRCVSVMKQKYKTFRMPNFPDEISENLVRLIIKRKTGLMPDWKQNSVGNSKKCGDLYCDGKKFEVKCFTSSGPSSFGPTETWSEIYFLDARDYLNKCFKCYRILLNETEFGTIKINSTQTYHDQCLQKRRPRISFDQLIKQLENTRVEVIFDGHIDTLFVPQK